MLLVCRPQLEGFAGRFESKPVLGFVSTLIHDYTPLVDDYYFCKCCTPRAFAAEMKADPRRFADTS